MGCEECDAEYIMWRYGDMASFVRRDKSPGHAKTPPPRGRIAPRLKGCLDNSLRHISRLHLDPAQFGA